MTSFLRNLFSAGPQHGPARSRSKGHSRSNSTPPMEPRPMSTYVLINPAGNAGSKPSSPISKSRPKSTRTSSYSSATGQQPPAPSPLRYTTHDTAPSHRHGTTSLSGHQGSSSGRSTHERPPIPRSSSYKGERQPTSNYSIYAPRVSLSSTRSASSTAASHTAPSTTPSYGSVSSKASKPRRPVLKQTHTWNGTQKPHNPHAHVTFMNPSRTDALHMHPILTYSRLSQAPISYNVIHPPTSRTVVDRNTRASVPAHTLQQPATDPFTLSALVLTSEKLPWPVAVSSGYSGPKSYSADPALAQRKASTASPVTNNDVLHTLYETLHARVTQVEWDALGSGSRDQKRIWKTYETRCEQAGGGWSAGVRRVDWLGEKTKLVGIEVDKSIGGGGRGRLMFARP